MDAARLCELGIPGSNPAGGKFFLFPFCLFVLFLFCLLLFSIHICIHLVCNIYHNTILHTSCISPLIRMIGNQYLAYFVMRENVDTLEIAYITAGNRHKQNSWFCKEIREDNFGFGGGKFTKTLRKVCTCQKLKFSFLLLENCKIRECYAVANAFMIRNMYSLFLYLKCNSRKINRPTKNMTKIVTLLHF
jgi:hypothetical protein